MWAQDREGHTVLMGTRTMTCANASATLPFGAIDTPTQGGVASGAICGVRMGAVAAAEARISGGGSTITVLVDWLRRRESGGLQALRGPDIDRALPGLPGIDTALGFRVLDTTAMRTAVTRSRGS